MGGPIFPPDGLNSASDWQAWHRILTNAQYRAAADNQWSNSNHVGYGDFQKSSGDYVGYLQWCSGDKVAWDYDTSAGTISTTVSSATCPPGAFNRIPNEDCYDFLAYVLDEEPAGLSTDRWPDSLVDFEVTQDGDDFEVTFTYQPSSGSSYTATGSAKRSGSSWGTITVVVNSMSAAES